MNAPPSPTAGRPYGRRAVLGMCVAAGVGLTVGGQIQDVIERITRPVVLRDPTGLTSLLPTGGRFRIYSVTGNLPKRSAADYSLAVDGLVSKPTVFSYGDLQAITQREIVADFQCVTGWRVRSVAWSGVRLADLLDQVAPDEGATHLRFLSFDGVYSESLTLEQARRDDVMVALTLNGSSLPSRHGGPVRLYVAPMYGYKSLKWLERIELTAEEVPGYWERRGYDVDAWVGDSNGRSDDPI